MIKGFVFDLDGVITETAHLHYLAWKEIMLEMNVEYSEKENALLKGLPREKTLEAILKNHNLIKDFSLKDIEIISNRKNDLYKKYLAKNLSKDNILPNIENFLIEAKKRKIKMSIASSSYNAPEILKKIQLIDFFEYIVSPNDIKNGKPAPDIFLKGASALNLKPSECIGFEDALFGLEAIKKAKMKAVVITHNVKANWKQADLILSSTRELDIKQIINL